MIQNISTDEHPHLRPMSHNISNHWATSYKPINEPQHLEPMNHNISNQWTTTSPINEPQHLQSMSHNISNQWTTTSPINEPQHLEPMSKNRLKTQQGANDWNSLQTKYWLLYKKCFVTLKTLPHCDKSLDNFRALARSAAGTKLYITEVFFIIIEVWLETFLGFCFVINCL